MACGTAPPDIILVNGKVFTANADAPWAEAIAISGDRIIAAGDNASIAALAATTTRRIDARGRVVIPGQIELSMPADAMTPDKARALASDAYAVGVTSANVIADGAIKGAVSAFVAADPAMRLVLLRRPMPQADGTHADSRPFFPPQPTPRINVKGMHFDFASGDRDRLALVVGWAYGSEDPLSIHPLSPDVLDAYVDALEAHGAAQVWREKRPRLVGPVVVPARHHERLKTLGVVVAQKPGERSSMKSLLDAGVAVAFAPGLESRFAMVKRAMYDADGPERMTAAEAIRLMTAGAAFAEFSDREKGSIAVGQFADLAVLSADPFAAPPDTVAGIRSVMTMIGGRVVRETGEVR